MWSVDGKERGKSPIDHAHAHYNPINWDNKNNQQARMDKLKSRTTVISTKRFWTSSDKFGSLREQTPWKCGDPRDRDRPPKYFSKRKMCWTMKLVKIKTQWAGNSCTI